MAQATELEPRSARLKRVVVGRPMASAELEETLLPKWLALPIFASDPLSSVAYATEAALVVLVAASASAAHLVFPISLAIAALLAIVVLSYRQTVLVYESSGGAYVVAKDNLGKVPSLVAAAALLTDYVLTVAVSVAAGVLALTSAVAVAARSRADPGSRLRAADRRCQPARGEGGRAAVRAADVRLRRRRSSC